SWGCDLAIAVSFIWALTGRLDEINAGMREASSREGILHLLEGFSPALFVLAMIPGYTLIERAMWPWFPIPNVARGVYATSLFFSMLHVTVWPSPIPLFPLAIALGFLAYRTQSLVGSITLHSLFNAIATLAFVFYAIVLGRQPENGKAETSAARRP